MAGAALKSSLAGGRTYGRQAIWDAIRRLRSFTVLELADAVKQERSIIVRYLQRLARGGYVSGALTVHKKAKTWELIRDTGAEAPRLKEDGTPSEQGLLTEQMWRTIRMLETFSPLDLSICASTETHPVSESHARYYVHYLCAAGYLARITAPGIGRPATYRAVRSRYSGPRPPVVQQLQSVYDANLGKIVWHEDPDA